MNVEIFSEHQLNSIRTMDNALTAVDQLRRVQPISEVSQQELDGANQVAFGAYWDATRNIGPEGEILVDQEMVKVASGRLLQRGFPQFIKHEELNQTDKHYERIFGSKENNK